MSYWRGRFLSTVIHPGLTIGTVLRDSNTGRYYEVVDIDGDTAVCEPYASPEMFTDEAIHTWMGE